MAGPTLPFRFTIGQIVWWAQAPPVATEPWIIRMRLYMDNADSQHTQYGLVPTPTPHAPLSWAEEADLTPVAHPTGEPRL